MTDDTHDLARFLAAQQPVYDQALQELRDGRKRSHWMWFIFPQIEGLGHSAMAERYAISGRAEAEAYLAHPLLGARLRDCTEAMLTHKDRSAHAILGSPDDLKFRSSMTLFDAVSKKGSAFGQALLQFYDGEPDDATLARLG
ncbi:DUF1810 domain-containing protein [Rhizobium sp. SL86]|uniref:DUF1810 domain-containing protein n=1 Tax=Rhizobium sp. SL86 TaxID=2995148 RepID=UPI0022746A26|nr:DUF1810 domain-containing protein [Rhizobium sp. SL86]MCY1666229.1 DUF1810 domain-containing protein [Rhizobium sp. SL86]